MAKMKYLPVFLDNRKLLSALTDEQFGKVIRAAMTFMEDGTDPDLEPIEAIGYQIIKEGAIRSAAKYDETCAKNAENIRKRWNSKIDTTVYDGIRPNTTVYETIPDDTKNTKNKEQRTKNKKEISPDGDNIGASEAAPQPVKKKTTKAKVEQITLDPPTVDEVRAYCDERGITNVNPQYFVDYYSTTLPPWTKLNGEPVKNWKLTVITWSNNPLYNKQPQQSGYVPPPDDYPF